MLEFDRGHAEALDALFQEFESEVRRVGGEFLAHRFDEQSVVRWDTKTCTNTNTVVFNRFDESKTRLGIG